MSIESQLEEGNGTVSSKKQFRFPFTFPAIAVLGIFTLTAVTLFPLFFLRVDQTLSEKVGPTEDGRQLSISTAMYCGDNDDRFFPAKGWEQTLSPYLKDLGRLKPKYKSLDGKITRFAMNKALIGKLASRVLDDSATPLFFLSKLKSPSAVGGKNDVAKMKGNQTVIAFVRLACKEVPFGKHLKLPWENKPVPAPAVPKNNKN